MKRREPPNVRSIGERGNSIPLEDWELEDATGGAAPSAPSPIPLPYPNATGAKRDR